MIYNGFDYNSKSFNLLKKGDELEVLDFFTIIESVNFYIVSPKGWRNYVQILSEKQMEELK